MSSRRKGRVRFVHKAAPVGRGGFTLIELSAVLLIAALLATAVTVSMKRRERRATLEDVTQRIVHADRLTREHARRFGRPAQLVLDLERGVILRVDAQSQKPLAPPMALPRRFSIESVWTAGARTSGVSGAASADSANVQRVTYGQAVLPCSTRGYTPTYAVQTKGPAGEARSLLVTGLTGEVTHPDADAVESIFAALAPPSSAGATGDDAR